MTSQTQACIQMRQFRKKYEIEFWRSLGQNVAEPGYMFINLVFSSLAHIKTTYP